MKTSENIEKLAPALNKAQAEMLPLVKDSENPFFKSKYADLHQVTSACYPALQANGISVLQSNRKDGDTLIVSTRLLHETGQWIETECVIPAVKADAHAYGSAYTYGRRYGLQAAVGLAPEDDDGNSATKSQEKAPPPANKTDQEKIAAKLSVEPDAKWFEVSFPSGKAPHKGKTLGDVAAEQDVASLAAVLKFIDEYVLDYPVAKERLDSAIHEASTEPEGSTK